MARLKYIEASGGLNVWAPESSIEDMAEMQRAMDDYYRPLVEAARAVLDAEERGYAMAPSMLALAAALREVDRG